MNPNLAIHQGDYTVWGVTRNPRFLQQTLPERLGIQPRIFDWGRFGHFFFYTTYADLTETEEALALKVGFVRRPSSQPLSITELLQQRLIGPGQIETNALRGNALLAYFSKREAHLATFKTLVSTPQLYYTVTDHGFICADALRFVTALVDHLELNEAAVPAHFLFRFMHGSQTYYRNIYQLYPGQLLTWREDRLEVKRVKDLRFNDNVAPFKEADTVARRTLYEGLGGLVDHYVQELQQKNGAIANLLSGGVDSSLIQLLLNERAPDMPRRSFSFAPKVQGFEYELGYAEHASERFGTRHTFVPVEAGEYPRLLRQCIDILAQPVLAEVEPCKVGLAEYLTQHEPDYRYFFVAVGAEALFGDGNARKLRIFETAGKVPGAGLALQTAVRLFQPAVPDAHKWLKAAHAMSHSSDDDSFVSFINTSAMHTSMDLIRRCFGDDVTRKTLAERRQWEIDYLDSHDATEKVHVVDLTTVENEIPLQSNHLFMAYGLQQIYPLMDEDSLRLSFAFDPKIRYAEGVRQPRIKYLLKDILVEHNLASISEKRKGDTQFIRDLYGWMRQPGELHDMVMAIDLPSFVDRKVFQQLVTTDHSDMFLWTLLTYDLFRQRILQPV